MDRSGDGRPQVPVRTYRDLVAWQVSMDLATAVCRATTALPKEERLGLAAQLRRSAISVPSNIAEGFGRGRGVEFGRFLKIARGSLFELQTQAELARRMTWLRGAPLREVRSLSRRLDAVLAGLIRSPARRAEGSPTAGPRAGGASASGSQSPRHPVTSLPGGRKPP